MLGSRSVSRHRKSNRSSLSFHQAKSARRKQQLPTSSQHRLSTSSASTTTTAAATTTTTTTCSIPPRTQSLPMPKGRKKRVVVGISGGVDSATTAALLIHQGYDVVPIYMTNWDASDENNECTAEEDLFQARKVAQHLGLELREVNFSKEYWVNIFETVLKGYSNGITPNPDILCNKHIKFGVFFEHAMKLFEPDFVATGHYARVSFANAQKWTVGVSATDGISEDVIDSLSIRRDASLSMQSILSQFKTIFQSDPHDIISSHRSTTHTKHAESTSLNDAETATTTTTTTTTLNPALQALFSDPSFIATLPQFRTYDPLSSGHRDDNDEYQPNEAFLTTSVDTVKDQTYFLSAIDPSKLPQILFPIGHYPKKLTRSLASIVALPNSERRDSMGVCFVGQKGDFGDFLAQYLSDEQQFPGTMMSVEQFIELMYIYSVANNELAQAPRPTQKHHKTGVINDDLLTDDDSLIPFNTLSTHKQTNQVAHPVLNGGSVTGLDVSEKHAPLPLLPIPNHPNSRPNHIPTTRSYSITPTASDLGSFEAENNAGYWKATLHDDDERKYEKGLKSMNYHKTIPKGEESLIPYPPHSLTLTANEHGVMLSERVTENDNIDRVAVPFNQQHHLKMDKTARERVVAEKKLKNTLHDNVQIKYSSARYIDHFRRDAIDLCHLITRSIHNGVGIAGLDDQTRGEIDQLMAVVKKVESFGDALEADSHTQQKYQVPKTLSVLPETLSLIAAIPILQQIGHFIHQFKEYETKDKSSLDYTASISSLPGFYQHSSLDFSPHQSHHSNSLHSPSDHTDTTPTTQPPRFEMHSFDQFFKISVPIWLKVINLVIQTPYKQSLDDSQIKALRTAFHTNLQTHHSIPTLTSQDMLKHINHRKEKQNGDGDGERDDDLDKTEGKKAPRSSKKQSFVPRPPQSIYHQQVHTLLKLLPTSLVNSAGANHSNWAAQKGVLENHTEFNTTKVMGSDVWRDMHSDANRHLHQITGFNPLDYDASEDDASHSQQQSNQKTLQSQSFSLAQFYPNRHQWFRSTQSTNTRLQHTHKGTHQHGAHKDELAYNAMNSTQIDRGLDDKINAVPGLGAKLSQFENLSANSVFKHLSAIHYQVQINVHDLINYRTRLALVKNGIFKRSETKNNNNNNNNKNTATKNNKQNLTTSTAPSSIQFELDTAAKPFASQWKRAYQSRGRYSEIFPSSYRQDKAPFGGLDVVLKSTNKKSPNPTSPSSTTSPTQSLLTRTVADSILHHKLYKRYFGQYHNGLIRYTENQRLGALGARETVLMKIPASNTLLYTTGQKHPFSLKNSCILTGFVPLSTNPFHLMQIPTQINDLGSESLCDETVERLMVYSNDLYSRSMKSMGNWVVANQNRTNDDIRVATEAQVQGGKAKAPDGGKTDNSNGGNKANQQSTPPQNDGQEGYALRVGPPPIIMNDNKAVFRSYRALFPFSDFGFMRSSSQNSTTPLSNAISRLVGQTHQNDRPSGFSSRLQNDDGDGFTKGYKAYAKIRSTGALLPCRLILEDIPLPAFLHHSIQKMNQNNIGSFYQSEEAIRVQIENERGEVKKLYGLLDEMDRKILSTLSTLPHSSATSLYGISPLSRPLFHQNGDGVDLFRPDGDEMTLLHSSNLTKTDLGCLREKVYSKIRTLETNIHLHHPTTIKNNDGSVTTVNPTQIDETVSNTSTPGQSESVSNTYQYKRVIRVLFDHQQEFLSNGQTIAIYIPTETTISNDVDLKNSFGSDKNKHNVQVQSEQQQDLLRILDPTYSSKFPSVLQSDIDYESKLYQTMGDFDLNEEFVELKGDKIHPAFSHDSASTPQQGNNDTDSNLHSIPQRLSQPHQIFDGMTLLRSGQVSTPSIISGGQKSAALAPQRDPFEQYFDAQRNTTLPTAFDRFICLGSGTIVL